MGVVSEKLNGKSLSCGHSLHGFRALGFGPSRFPEERFGQVGRLTEPGGGSDEPLESSRNLKKVIKNNALEGNVHSGRCRASLSNPAMLAHYGWRGRRG